MRCHQRRFCPVWPFNSPFQCPDYLFFGIWRNLCGRPVSCRLSSWDHLGCMLHCCGRDHCQAKRLSGNPRKIQLEAPAVGNPSGNPGSFSNYSSYRRHHCRYFYCHRRFCYCCGICPDLKYLLSEYFLEILLENCGGQRQDERHDCVPHWSLQYYGMGHGLHSDSSGHLRSSFGTDLQSCADFADYECDSSYCRNLYGCNTCHPYFHTPVFAGRKNFWHESHSIRADSGI